MSKNIAQTALWPWFVLAITPLFFSTNLVFGRGVSTEVAPFTLAFIRWSICSAILFPFVWRARHLTFSFIKNHTKLWLLLGFLGMWICGAIVYLALHYTSAINAALIYTTTTVFTIIIQRIWLKRPIKFREVVGIISATLGVAFILLKGELERFLRLEFNIGDLLMVICTISWALYSVLQKSDACKNIPTFPIFGLLTLAGAITLAPFALYEFMTGADMPQNIQAWTNIGGIIFFSSLLAFSGIQYCIRALGPEYTSLSLYLLPVYGSLLAIILLGEPFRNYHMIGIILVLGGVILATAPKNVLNRLNFWT